MITVAGLTDIDEVFGAELKDRKIFKDLRVLSPHYVPDELPHRESEAVEITKIIAPVLRGEKPDNIFIYGKTGTGKTSVVKYVIRKLGEITNDPEKNPNKMKVMAVYMNCRLSYNSKYQVLLRILNDEALKDPELRNRPLEGTSEKKLLGASPTKLCEKLKAVIEGNGLEMLVVLDEIDTIKDVNDLMYILTRMNDELGKGHISIIGISNRATFKENLDSRSKSTLCEEELVFKAYNANQLRTILMHRAKLGFQPGTIANPEVSLIAAFAAKTNGDARYALQLLQKSGEIAQNAGRSRVTREDVEKARLKVEEDIMYELISTLPENQQIVLYAVAEGVEKGGKYKKLADTPNDVLSSGEIYEIYESLCKKLNKKPRTMRWFREYLNDLEMLGLITLTVSGKGVRGNTSFIRLGSPPAEIKEIIRQSMSL